MNPFLTGKTVFGNGSHAPTRGTNNPAGYIKREINNGADVNKSGPFGGVSTFGSTGKSETRSGLARKALERQGSKEPKPNTNSGFVKRKNPTGLAQKVGQSRKERKRLIVTKFGALKLGRD